MSGAELTASALSALANLILAAAAVAAALAAFMGLDSWKKQHVWQRDHELARRFLVSLYRYRDSLYSVRHPVMHVAEMKVADADAKGLSPDEIRTQGVVNAYSRRWERHQQMENELDALLLETTAVWGSELAEKVSALKALRQELFAYIWLYLDANYRSAPGLADSLRKLLKEKRDILYDLMDDEDVFRKDFEHLMKPVEVFLRGKLGRAS